MRVGERSGMKKRPGIWGTPSTLNRWTWDEEPRNEEENIESTNCRRRKIAFRDIFHSFSDAALPSDDVWFIDNATAKCFTRIIRSVILINFKYCRSLLCVFEEKPAMPSEPLKKLFLKRLRLLSWIPTKVSQTREICARSWPFYASSAIYNLRQRV